MAEKNLKMMIPKKFRAEFWNRKNRLWKVQKLFIWNLNCQLLTNHCLNKTLYCRIIFYEWTSSGISVQHFRGSTRVFIEVAVFYQTVLVFWTIIVSSLILLCLVIVFSSKILPAFLKKILNKTQVSSFETYVETGYEYTRILWYHVHLFCNEYRTVPHVLHKLAGFRSRLLDPKKL